MDSEKQGIFLLALKKSKKREGITYCIGVFRLGTPNIEFILGETDNDREYRVGEEVAYIYNADYVGSMQAALDWLNNRK
ncbi:hypothetical protein NXU87_12470 [Candidatus Bacteroides intestinigallinarum]|uniref:hypothetical protein n=1 Tax=Bacteroides TaxID=816 RepID=UPI000E930443|nr:MULTISPECIES: hypothetical protein [Bacteroides]MCS3176913.1 hypothetical protein [Candidatus Bacteroides intestinigallinarum]RGN53190.1 hypothetical protein DXB58_25745 [Bacteroides sp. OM05-10AA]RGQ57004.1 hypothetical protein DWY87_26270 [Bacteroides sp. AF27-33]